MRVHLNISKKFGGHFVILEKNGSQNINFGGKNGSLEKQFGPEWNLRKVRAKMVSFGKKK